MLCANIFCLEDRTVSMSLGDSHFTVKNLPAFTDYPVTEIYKGPIALVKLSSHAKAKGYRTRLKAAAAKGPNFAGHYIVEEIGCGSSCQTVWVIDAITGKIILGDYCTSFGAEYSLNSRLLVLNPLPDDADESDFSGVFSNLESKYLVMNQGKLDFIFKEKMSNLVLKK